MRFNFEGRIFLEIIVLTLFKTAVFIVQHMEHEFGTPFGTK